MYMRRSRVPVSTGDAQLAHIPNDAILLIKIDVEGYEMTVLRGLRKTLERVGAPVYVEVLGVDHFLDGTYSREYFGVLSQGKIMELVDSRVANGREVEHVFREIGYCLFKYNKEGSFSAVKKIELDDPIPGAQGERNFLAMPAAKNPNDSIVRLS